MVVGLGIRLIVTLLSIRVVGLNCVLAIEMNTTGRHSPTAGSLFTAERAEPLAADGREGRKAAARRLQARAARSQRLNGTAQESTGRAAASREGQGRSSL